MAVGEVVKAAVTYVKFEFISQPPLMSFAGEPFIIIMINPWKLKLNFEGGPVQYEEEVIIKF